MVLLGIGATSAAHAGGSGESKVASAARGQALFEGKAALSGRIRDHLDLMPAGVLVCGNCHVSPPVDKGSNIPALSSTDLLTSKVRRNGPPSAYTLDTFCRVLRTGVDPVHITLSREMPLFVVSVPQCESLWLYLIGRQPE